MITVVTVLSMERLSTANKSSKHCSELTKDYKSLQYYSTLTYFSRGEDHSWKLSSVVPMLSDMVILPRLLEPTRIQTVMASFSRAIRKCMRDSIIMAEETKYKENTREKAGNSTTVRHGSEPKDQHPTMLHAVVLHH